MIHVFLNGLAASAGGGLTYLRNVLPHLSQRGDVRVTAVMHSGLRDEFAGLPNLALLQLGSSSGAMGRVWREQSTLPELIRRSGADVLISAGNFALRRSPVPQILLSRNSLYTSSDFVQDLLRRREYAMWLDTRIKGVLARRSVKWADRTVAPTMAFAEELRRWTGCEVVAIPHGFDREAFFRDQTPLDISVRRELEQGRDSNSGPDKSTLRLLFVSHYNYYRNFETLIRALPILRERLGTRKVKLFLTCRLRSEENPGPYRADAAAALVAQLGIADDVVELGTIPYSLLHQVYRACDIYVSPAYAESFAHPLVEAMASGLPVVAADAGVHREICQDAAVYFSRFSPEELAGRISQLADSASLMQNLADRGLARSRDFSWERHVDGLLNLATNLLATIESVKGHESSAGTRYKAS
jgi:glycosyltransferase involved in cell wall biosynthesis